MQDAQVGAEWAKGLFEACGGAKRRGMRSSNASSIFAVPYDEEGHRLPGTNSLHSLHSLAHPDARPTLLNLEVGAKVRIPLGEFVGDEGEVIGFDGDAWQIRFRHKKSVSKTTWRFVETETPRTVVRRLGKWWGASAVNGDTEMLPVVSVCQTSARAAAAKAGVWQPLVGRAGRRRAEAKTKAN